MISKRKGNRRKKNTEQGLSSRFFPPPRENRNRNLHRRGENCNGMRMYHHRCNCRSFSCKSRFRRSDTAIHSNDDSTTEVASFSWHVSSHPLSLSHRRGEMPHDPRSAWQDARVRSERTRFSSALSVGPRPCLFIKCTAYLHARTWPRVMYRDSSHVGRVGSGGKPKPGHR